MGNHTLTVSFVLPPTATSTNTVFAVTVNLLGDIETITKPVPVATPDTLTLHFFPESGAMVCGFMNRVYLRAEDARGEGVNIAGFVTSERGERVAEVAAGRDGRGVIHSLLGRRDGAYVLHVTKPVNATVTTFTLPGDCQDRIFMRYSGMTESGQIRVMIGAEQRAVVSVTVCVSCGDVRRRRRLEAVVATVTKEVATSEEVLLDVHGVFGVGEARLCEDQVLSITACRRVNATCVEEAERVVFVLPPPQAPLDVRVVNAETEQEGTVFDAGSTVEVRVRSGVSGGGGQVEA